MRNILLGLLFLTNTLYAQKVETDFSACYSMLNVLEAMKANVSYEAVAVKIDSVLNTKPYQIMFQHYNRSWRPNHLPEQVFKRMILSLKFKEQYTKGENQRADAMFALWQKEYENLDLYKKNLLLLEKIKLPKLIQKGVSDAQKWLPASMKIPDFYFFIHPNGGSTAFAINGNQGYDFFQLDKTPDGLIDIQKLINVIAHESHHLGLKTKQKPLKSSKDSLAYQFLMTFVAEGTASKFVDNLPGGRIPKISKKGSRNFDVATKHIWKQYSEEEQAIFASFETDFEKIYNGTYNQDSVQYRITTYWLSSLKGRAYFVGAELFGAIYKAFGKKKLFDVMEDPTLLLKTYNSAVAILNKKKIKAIPLSSWLIQHF
jgi:hypothetical protein